MHSGRRRVDRPAAERLWRSIDEFDGLSALGSRPSAGPIPADGRRPTAGSPTDEFPPGAAMPPDGLSRRRFIELLGATMALAGLEGCVRQPPERIVPYVEQPDRVIPGKPLYFATAHTLSGYARGILVQSREGRPIKVEGNPQHPASHGATEVFAQAATLGLYDPDRSRTPSSRGVTRSLDAFRAALGEALAAARQRDGEGLALLTGNVTSPTLLAQVRALLDALPGARWYVHDPATGERPPVQAVYAFDAADVILALDSDFLTMEPGSVRYARDFAEQRRVLAGAAEMNRLYAVEPMMTVTGAKADHRLPMPAGRIAMFTAALAQHLDANVSEAPVDALAALNEREQHWLEAIADDLRAHRGRSIIVAGDRQPPIVHRLAHAINSELDNVGQTVRYLPRFDAAAMPEARSLGQFAADVDAGAIDALIISDCNPVHTAPADLDFAARLARLDATFHHGLYENETAEACTWHVPMTHEFEMWSDARAFDGSATIIQPLILPLYRSISPHDLLNLLLDAPGRSGYETARQHWRQLYTDDDFEAWWTEAVHWGIVPDSAVEPLADDDVEARLAASADGPQPAPEQQPLELNFALDPRIWDGRYANNAWLQELPKPITKLTWDNAALMSVATAERLDVTNENLIELTFRGRSIVAPVWVVPGHADGAVTVHLGYGRRLTGRVGDDIGFNAYALRTTDALWFGDGLTVRRVPGRHRLATTQQHHQLEGRDMVRHGTLKEFRRDSKSVLGDYHEPVLSLYKPYIYAGYKWAMSIDLTTCIGCGTCTIACQAENNIPVVGKEGVLRGREMHWIRVDRYFAGTPEEPEVFFQPVPCMHCEKAPCEVVCPVGATLHSDEGLNEMIYNRCIGTRYCSNNCPYKVRRFNFFDYVENDPDVLKALRNPEVTVRGLGVMEKCTYCVQRIENVRIEAHKAKRSILPGEVETACQAACPTRAIIFGDMNNPDSPVTPLKEQPHDYGMLAHLNTQPRTTYLAEITNPNHRLHNDVVDQENGLDPAARRDHPRPEHAAGRGHR